MIKQYCQTVDFVSVVITALLYTMAMLELQMIRRLMMEICGEWSVYKILKALYI